MDSGANAPNGLHSVRWLVYERMRQPTDIQDFLTKSERKQSLNNDIEYLKVSAHNPNCRCRGDCDKPAHYVIVL